MDIIKIRNLSLWKTVKKVKRQDIDWKKILVKHGWQRTNIKNIKNCYNSVIKDKSIKVGLSVQFEQIFHTRKYLNG